MTDKLINFDEVKKLTGLSRSKVYRDMREGKFPRQHPVVHGRWNLSKIERFIATGEL